MKQTGLMLLLLSAVLVGSGCILEPPPPEDINLDWEVVSFSAQVTYVAITYHVSNNGDYDLNDVQLQFALDTDSDGYPDAGYQWTDPFNINSGQTLSNRIVNVNYLFPGNVDYVMVVGAGMENPEDED